MDETMYLHHKLSTLASVTCDTVMFPVECANVMQALVDVIYNDCSVHVPRCIHDTPESSASGMCTQMDIT